MRPRSTFIAIVLLSEAIAFRAGAADSTRGDLERRFDKTVHPFIRTYCFECHGKEKQKGQLDLRPFSTLEAVTKDYGRWEILLEQLKTEEMPPEEAKKQPKAELRREVIDWIQAMRKYEARRNAGDPGPVLARRLSNAEYDYTIRDLTGVDIRPTKEFPVDPANEAGFDNSGESLMMSPALVKKHLEVARRVAEHLVLQPEGVAFAPHPVITDTDRDKYAVKRIVQFYQRQATNYADYFQTAWRFKHRAALGKPKASLADLAAEEKISSKYLATIWSTLTGTQDDIGPFAAVQALWRDLPSGNGKQPEAVRRGCERMSEIVLQLRQKVKPEFKNLTVRGMHNGSQSLVLWKDRQYATNRMRYTGGALELQLAELASGTPASAALVIPTDEAACARYEAAFNRFCAIFPDAFYVSERARIYLDPEKEKLLTGRLLSAGFHSQMGYFRDDAPLYQLILDQQGQRELDGLWQELNCIASAPLRQHRDFLWFERTDSSFLRGEEFDFARPEDKDSTSEAKIKRLAEVYLDKVRRNTTNSLAIEVVKDHFETVSRNIRAVERTRLAAEPSHLVALQAFAERAYRRPLSKTERDEVVGFYRSLRDKDGLDHEEAVRDTVVSVLMSPHFCYRVAVPAAGGGTRHAAAVGLRPGQSLELFPLVQHARPGTIGPRRSRGFASSEGSGRPGPPHVAG